MEGDPYAPPRAVVADVASAYRAASPWQLIGYVALTLLGLLGSYQSIPNNFARATYLGVLSIVVGLLGILTVCLLFTAPANAWFRTGGGRLTPP
jgi:hypothetical protein